MFKNFVQPDSVSRNPNPIPVLIQAVKAIYEPVVVESWPDMTARAFWPVGLAGMGGGNYGRKSTLLRWRLAF